MGVRPGEHAAVGDPQPFRAQLAVGLHFARTEAQIRFLLLVTFVVTFVVYHAALLPVIVTDLLHEGASASRCCRSPRAQGAITGTLIAGEFAHRRSPDHVAIAASIGCIALMYLVISASTELLSTALALAGFGFSYFVLSTVVQGLLIGSSPDEFRGRVMGLYTMVTAGGVPIAALIGGAIGSLVGPGEAVALAAIVMLGLLGWIVTAHRLRVVRFDVAAQAPDDPLPVTPLVE